MSLNFRNALTKSRSPLEDLNANRDNNVISAQHVTKRFATDKGADLTVLDDISFTLHDNEIVAILGRSGAGKSTFLRILAGLVQPSEGRVDYRGNPLAGPNPGVALVFQTFALMPWLTVQANVELGLEARGVPREQRRKVALAAIDSIGLDGFESAYPKELSGGMRQRVGIARALVLHPDALFMDEPFSALDVLTAENLRQEVLNLWNDKDHAIRSILMVTHNIEEAVEMADRVIVFGSHPGRIVAQVPVNLPRPRDRHSAEFEDRVDYLYSVMTGTKQGEAGEADKAAKTGASAKTDAAHGSPIMAAHEAAPGASSRSEAETAATTTAVPATITDPDSDHAASLAAAASSASPAPSTPSQPHSAAHAGTSQTTNTAITQPVDAAPGNTNGTSNRNDSRGQSGSSAASTQAMQPKQPSAAGANSDTEATQKAPENASGRLALPNATPGGLAGLLDVIAESPEDVALSDLASLLSFEVDDLFPLIDAGTMLGVLSIHDGRAHLTDQGMAWHNADILESKTVFAQLALEHAPLVRMIDQALKKSKSGRLRGELILDLLRNRHEDAKAWQQFHIAVTWGRYGELFDYDADDDLLIIDEENR